LLHVLKFEGEIEALRGGMLRSEQALALAQHSTALATEKCLAASSTAASATRRADEAERNLASSVSETQALREEVARLRIADVGEMESAWASQLEQLQRVIQNERKEAAAAHEQLIRRLENQEGMLSAATHAARSWEEETSALRIAHDTLKRTVAAFSGGGRDGAIESLLEQLHAARKSLRQGDDGVLPISLQLTPAPQTATHSMASVRLCPVDIRESLSISIQNEDGDVGKDLFVSSIDQSRSIIARADIPDRDPDLLVRIDELEKQIDVILQENAYLRRC
jgi:hypothetical protein